MPLVLFLAVLALAALAPFSAFGASKGEPRLSVLEAGSPPDEVEAGEDFPIAGKVANRGRKAARATVLVQIRGGELDGLKLGRERVGRVEPKRRARFEVEARARRALAPPQGEDRSGPYRIEACVKSAGEAGARGLKCRKAKGRMFVARGDDPDPPPRFKPGARTLGDPLFPQIGNGGYDARHYAIELDYRPANNRFGGATGTTMTAVATQNLSQFSLDFQDLEVSRVLVDGEPARFRQRDARPKFSENPNVTQPMKLIVTPAEGIRRGEQFSVQVDYTGVPEEITDADESIEGWIRACPTDRNCDGAFVVNEPIGAQSWFPSNNYATDKASYRTSITVPETHTALGVGELDSQTDGMDGTTTWTWSEDDPTASYLTTATVGRFDYEVSSMTETLTGLELPIYEAIDSRALPSQKTDIRAKADRIPEMTNFLSERFGPYPFDSSGLVADWAPGVGYALEVQTKAHFAGNEAGPSVSTSTLLHEVAHQWMGNSVSPATWLEIWFNEGWATFSEIYWGHKANGSAQSPRQFFNQTYDRPEEDWEIAPARLDGDPANLFAGFPVYIRPAAMLEGYRQIVGERRFFLFARALLNRHGYDVVDIDQFITAAKQTSGLEGAKRARLERYFEQWLLREAKPALTPDDFPRNP